MKIVGAIVIIMILLIAAGYAFLWKTLREVLREGKMP